MTITPNWSLFDAYGPHDEPWQQRENELESRQREIEEGERRRDEGMARADYYADLEWKTAAYQALVDVAYLTPFLTSDEVWDRIDGPETHEHRALGAIFRRAAEAGVIAPTDTYRPTARPEAHRRPVRVWRSLICREGMARAA